MMVPAHVEEIATALWQDHGLGAVQVELVMLVMVGAVVMLVHVDILGVDGLLVVASGANHNFCCACCHIFQLLVKDTLSM